MNSSTLELEVWIDGATEPLLVRADQRDMARFELEYKVGSINAIDVMPMVYFRFLGWAALRRTGKIPPGTSRDDWLDTVSSVETVDDDEEPMGPGNPAASEGPSSS